MKRVLIADHHPVTREGIKNTITHTLDFQTSDEAGSSQELFSCIENQLPDLVVLEMEIPGTLGISTLKRIREVYPDIKVLIFSNLPEDVYALSTIRAGAHGYLNKTADPIQLITAMERISDGHIFITNELAQRLALDEGSPKPRKHFKKLSVREVEVLKMLAKGKRNKEVALGLNLNEKTISTYKARLMKKLNVNNLVDLLQQAKALELY